MSTDEILAEIDRAVDFYQQSVAPEPDGPFIFEEDDD